MSNNPQVTLAPLEPDDKEQFILDNQEAFKYGATQEFGMRDDHFEEDDEIINPYQMLLNAISSLTQPLFAQGRLKANLSVAQSQQEQAQIAFEKALLVAGGEVRDALADCQACSTREEARTKQVEAAQQAYENSRLTMQYANTSYLEVLIAQSAWLDAQLQQTADWLEKQQSRINLFKATCGGK